MNLQKKANTLNLEKEKSDSHTEKYTQSRAGTETAAVIYVSEWNFYSLQPYSVWSALIFSVFVHSHFAKHSLAYNEHTV